MGKKGKAKGLGMSAADVEMKRQLDELKAKQAAALAAVQKATEELQAKTVDMNDAKADLDEVERAKKEADGSINNAVKMVTGDDREMVRNLSEGLERDGYAFVDNFLGDPLATYIRQELQILHRDGGLQQSELAGGKTGKNLRYSMAKVRGDVVQFVSGDEEGCHNMGLLREFSDQIVIRVQERVKELQATSIKRGKLMCTCYPGGDRMGVECGEGGPCRYILHCDNPDQNGRRLTTLYYLNPDWEASHGGELRIHPQQADGSNKKPHVDIAPLHDRFLIFYSDRRNPHEVLFSKRPRYAITTWYYDGEEREQALAGAEGGGGEGGSAEMEVEAERIRREIQKFESGGGVGGKKQPEEKGGAKGGGVEMVSDTSIKGVVEIARGGNGKKAVQVDLEELD